ncbi:MAG TPA: glutathione peroxidase [Bacteroidia bacterium]
MLLPYLKNVFGRHQCIVRPNNTGNAPKSFHNLSSRTITGEHFHFSQLKGKKVLIVNTASQCSYTDQYSILESFQQMYQQSLVILGFPCNDFFRQEPESEAKIQQFCRSNYDISFPMFEKSSTIGSHKSPVYKWLSEKSQNGWNHRAPQWNFCKYLVDENGELLLYATSAILPTHKDFISLVEH